MRDRDEQRAQAPTMPEQLEPCQGVDLEQVYIDLTAVCDEVAAMDDRGEPVDTGLWLAKLRAKDHDLGTACSLSVEFHRQIVEGMDGINVAYSIVAASELLLRILNDSESNEDIIALVLGRIGQCAGLSPQGFITMAMNEGLAAEQRGGCCGKCGGTCEHPAEG